MTILEVVVLSHVVPMIGNLIIYALRKLKDKEHSVEIGDISAEGVWGSILLFVVPVITVIVFAVQIFQLCALIVEKIKNEAVKYKERKEIERNPHYETIYTLQNIEALYRTEWNWKDKMFIEYDFSRMKKITREQKDHRIFASMLINYDHSLKQTLAILESAKKMEPARKTKVMESSAELLRKVFKEADYFMENIKSFEEEAENKTMGNMLEQLEKEKQNHRTQYINKDLKHVIVLEHNTKK